MSDADVAKAIRGTVATLRERNPNSFVSLDAVRSTLGTYFYECNQPQKLWQYHDEFKKLSHELSDIDAVTLAVRSRFLSTFWDLVDTLDRFYSKEAERVARSAGLPAKCV